ADTSKYITTNYKDIDEKKTDIIIYSDIVEKLNHQYSSSNSKIIEIDYKETTQQDHDSKIEPIQNFKQYYITVESDNEIETNFDSDDLQIESSTQQQINYQYSEIFSKSESELSDLYSDDFDYTHKQKKELNMNSKRIHESEEHLVIENDLYIDHDSDFSENFEDYESDISEDSKLAKKAKLIN
ncbi:3422_t:CDS:2, partial [Dentiscutata erythropus]